MTRNEVLEAVDALEKCDGAVDETHRKTLAAKVRVAFMATEQAWEEQDTLLQDFRQALPENERGPGWEQAVLTAIDTRREVLAAVDKHVQGWHPGREPAEVVAHLTDEITLLRDAELGAQEVAAEALAALRKAEDERDAAKARLAKAESARDGNARQVEALRAWEKDAAASLRRLNTQLDALRRVAHPVTVKSGLQRDDAIEDLEEALSALRDEPVSPAYEFASGERLAKADAADAIYAIRPAIVTDKYTEGIVVACEEFAHRLGLDVGHGPPNAAGYGEARLQAHLARYRATEPASPVFAMGPDTVWTNGRIRVHRSGTVQIGPHWDAIQDGDLQALGAAMVRMRADMLATDPYVSRVTEFHRAMGLPVRTVPSVGTVEERILRVRLLLEEVLEYAKASAVRVLVHVGHGGVLHGASDLEFEPHDADEPDLVAMTHELGDCQVIVAGCAVQLGLPLLAAVSEEIHPANMRKVGPDGRPIVRADGKVVKPEGWKPANVARVVERALATGEVSHG